MTDQEAAAVLWEYIDYAIERAIVLSEREIPMTPALEAAFDRLQTAKAKARKTWNFR